jgi:hypothetical protein
MRKREFDARVGYFANEYGVFEEESQNQKLKFCCEMAFGAKIR